MDMRFVDGVAALLVGKTVIGVRPYEEVEKDEDGEEIAPVYGLIIDTADGAQLMVGIDTNEVDLVVFDPTQER